jgi:histidinol phosphatase-like PHP family hydrolase
MIDLHTHHDRCGHAEGSLADVAGWATLRGIAVLGVSDHAPRFADPADHPLPDTQMARSQWDGYLAEAAALRDELAGRLDLRVGVEADYLPGTEAVYRAALDRPELDYVLGSVHEVPAPGGAWALFHPETYADADLDEVHRRYWETVAAAATSGLFDVLAHLDLVRMLPPPEPARRGGRCPPRSRTRSTPSPTPAWPSRSTAPACGGTGDRTRTSRSWPAWCGAGCPSRSGPTRTGAGSSASGGGRRGRCSARWGSRGWRCFGGGRWGGGAGGEGGSPWKSVASRRVITGVGGGSDCAGQPRVGCACGWGPGSWGCSQG